jgi:hypothetical protein
LPFAAVMRPTLNRPKVVVRLDRDMWVVVRALSPWGEPVQHAELQDGGVGMPMLLWKVENGRQSTECVGGEREDGCYWARVLCNGQARELAIFGTQGEAIRWALDRELEMVAEGWRRVL